MGRRYTDKMQDPGNEMGGAAGRRNAPKHTGLVAANAALPWILRHRRVMPRLLETLPGGRFRQCGSRRDGPCGTEGVRLPRCAKE